MSVDKLGLYQICNVKMVSNLNNVYLIMYCIFTFFRNYAKLTASWASPQPPSFFGVALPLTSAKGSAPLAHWARPQIHNPPFQNPGSTGVQHE